MLRLIIEHDLDTTNPFEDGDGRWTFYSLHPRKTPYIDLYQFLHPNGELKKNIQKKIKSGLAFWCDYFEHGQCVWSIHGTGPQCRWDNSPMAGLLVWEHPAKDMGATSYEDRKKDAAAALEEYTEWCNGNCYYYTIERIHTCKHCGSETHSNILASGGSLIGDKWLFEVIRETLDDYPDEEVEVTGDCAGLADYESIRSEPAPTE